jgi:hypothetical protein
MIVLHREHAGRALAEGRLTATCPPPFGGSTVVPTQPDRRRRTRTRIIAVARFRVELRRTAAICVGGDQDYESVALPLSYPGARTGSLPFALHSRRLLGRLFGVAEARSRELSGIRAADG